ncbi:MAG: phosphoglycerate kinase [Chromatiales bacterium]|nr:phosphoglycerate kinase [Chromatiales bacterium]
MKAGTVVWNGPVGVFEFDQFGAGTKTIADGDRQHQVPSPSPAAATPSPRSRSTTSTTRCRYISTAGGAFLEFLEGKKLPAVDILEQRAKK